MTAIIPFANIFGNLVWYMFDHAIAAFACLLQKLFEAMFRQRRRPRRDSGSGVDARWLAQ
ncbi:MULTISPECIES: hypothetical protein [unclassified Rhizobium]|uniref:hypothetical protein n=1 Tax=unclassified Rhizobium TaxID=2613769 RepID=UPI00381D92E3